MSQLGDLYEARQGIAQYYSVAVQLQQTPALLCNLAAAYSYAGLTAKAAKKAGYYMDRAICAATMSNTCPTWLRNALVHQAAKCAGRGVITL